jgi:hypothetical protein
VFFIFSSTGFILRALYLLGRHYILEPTPSPFALFIYLFLLLCWVGVHCGIYKSSYHISNISYLNSSHPSFPLSSTPKFWNLLMGFLADQRPISSCFFCFILFFWSSKVLICFSWLNELPSFEHWNMVVNLF